MKKLVVTLVALAMLALFGSSAFAIAGAGPIRQDCDTAEIWLYIASWVEIEFDDIDPFFLDIEAGYTDSEDTIFSAKPFTVHHNCDVTVTGSLITPPVGAPGGITFSHYFDGNPLLTSVNYLGLGPSSGTVHLVATGNDINNIPAGLWKNGVFRICVDALNPEPDTDPFPQP